MHNLQESTIKYCNHSNTRREGKRETSRHETTHNTTNNTTLTHTHTHTQPQTAISDSPVTISASSKQQLLRRRFKTLRFSKQEKMTAGLATRTSTQRKREGSTRNRSSLSSSVLIFFPNSVIAELAFRTTWL